MDHNVLKTVAHIMQTHKMGNFSIGQSYPSGLITIATRTMPKHQVIQEVQAAISMHPIEFTKLLEPEPTPEQIGDLARETVTAIKNGAGADAVNHPSHYNQGRIEVIEFIEDQRLNYHLGNTVKYICRAGKKDPAKTIEDLEKAAWYLRRRIFIERALLTGADVVRPNDMVNQ